MFSLEGNSFGLGRSLSSGLVSALDRSITDEDGTGIEHLVQTNAATNPGNLGGRLLDGAGRLIGINTAIYSPSGAFAGSGFAVPVDTANEVAPQLIADGRYIRPSLGISVDEVKTDLQSDHRRALSRGSIQKASETAGALSQAQEEHWHCPQLNRSESA